MVDLEGQGLAPCPSRPGAFRAESLSQNSVFYHEDEMQNGVYSCKLTAYHFVVLSVLSCANH